jgi:hypothetical protein
MEPSEVIESLPIDKSTKNTLLIISAGFLFAVFIACCAIRAKVYFDDWHSELIAQIDKSGKDLEARFDRISMETNKNTLAIEGLRKYYWSNNDMQQWARELDHGNRSLTVPAVPSPMGGR